MSTAPFRRFAVLFDRYYWLAAFVIAKTGLARQYRNSFLGMLWTLMQPFSMVVIYSLVMPLILRAPARNYAAYLMVSLPVWGFFSASLSGATGSVVANAEALKRCMISPTVFPVADVLRNTYTLFVSFTIMQAGVCFFVAPFDVRVLLVPLYFVPVLMIIGAAAIAIAFATPYLRDIGDLIVLVMTVMVWFTPILYPLSALPLWGQEWMKWNPFFIMMRPIQMLAYEHVMPGLSDTLRLIALTSIAVLLGQRGFSACRRNCVYYL